MILALDRWSRRCAWLRAWKLVATDQHYSLKIRQEYASRYNRHRFWWQKALQIPRD